jgi:hypothetical protein
MAVIQGNFPSGLVRVAVQQPKQAPGRPVHTDAVLLAPQIAALPTAGGAPLAPAVRQKMEAFFGTSFADVRVHVGPHASRLGAVSFTHGPNVHFAAGQYNPATPHGEQILGRALVHVIQQRAGRVRNPFGTGTAIVRDRMLEAEADRLVQRLTRFTLPPAVRQPAFKHYVGKSASVALVIASGQNDASASVTLADGITKTATVTGKSGSQAMNEQWTYNVYRTSTWAHKNKHRYDAEIRALEKLNDELYAKTAGGAWRYPAASVNGGTLTLTSSLTPCTLCQAVITSFCGYWGLTPNVTSREAKS